jgi:6-phosphogluconolactonase
MRHARRGLLLPLVLLALGLALSLGPAPAAAAPSPAPITVYVGTYTNSGSRGIYRFTLDPATGEAREPVLAGETTNPSFLALHPSGRFLYAVGEIESFAGRPTGVVSAFAIDAKTGDLKLLNQQPSEGTAPCHLVVDAAGRNVLVANYGGGTVAVLPIGADGRLAPASSVKAHEGTGPHRERQEKPHAHGIYLDAAGRHAVAADLGADRIFVYGFDSAKGQLQPAGAAVVEPGSGPRHLAFDASGRRLYAINELTSTITLFSYDPEKAALQPLQSVPTLPEGFAGANTTAEVVLSPDGRFLYGSNRGHDSIAVFVIDKASGKLTPAGHVAAGGAQPRHFAIEPSGRFMLVAHQDSDSIAVFRLDPATGRPVPTGTRLKVSKPVCLLPVPPAR